MLQAIDRPQLVEAIWSGQSTVANSYVSEDVALYHEVIEPSVVKYAYDPRQAAQMIEGLGYTKRADGFYYDGSGQKLSVQIYTTVQNDIHPKTTATVADYWQRLGVEVEQVLIPIQRAQDREYRATFPAFELVETTNAITPGDIRRLHSASTPLPENKFQVTGNNSRYRNPELDADIDRYITTIPMNERMQALSAVVHILSENLPTLPLFRGVDPTMVANRIVNVTARAEGWTQAWNVQDWEVKN
jgi:ABC-type transport system substrate-binding protein